MRLCIAIHQEGVKISSMYWTSFKPLWFSQTTSRRGVLPIPMMPPYHYSSFSIWISSLSFGGWNHVPDYLHMWVLLESLETKSGLISEGNISHFLTLQLTCWWLHSSFSLLWSHVTTTQTAGTWSKGLSDKASCTLCLDITVLVDDVRSDVNYCAVQWQFYLAYCKAK